MHGTVQKGGSRTDFLRKEFSGWTLKTHTMTRTKHDTWQSVEGRQLHRLPEEGVFRVEIKKPNMLIPGIAWKGGSRTDFLRKEFSGWKLKNKHIMIPGRVWKGGRRTDFLRKEFSGWKLKNKHMMIPGRVWKGGRRTDFLRKEFSGWKLKNQTCWYLAECGREAVAQTSWGRSSQGGN